MATALFTFQSSDGTEIFAMKWSPKNSRKPKVAVQIAHGYAEHIGRYDAFAGKLAEAGIVVDRNDHRGHGKTNENVGEAICFADEAGFDKVVADMRALAEIIQAEYPDLPLFLFRSQHGLHVDQTLHPVVWGRSCSGNSVRFRGIFECFAETGNSRGSIGNQKKWPCPSKSFAGQTGLPELQPRFQARSDGFGLAQP